MRNSSNFIFGIRSIIEAIHAGKEIEKVLLKKGLQGELFQELFDLIRDLEIPFQFVPIEKINRITTKNHQGVLAISASIEYKKIESLLPLLYESGKDPFFLILDGITDVRNFGALARSAECAGVHAIIIPDKGSVTITSDAIKTSAGALNIIPVCRTSNLKNTVKFLKDSGVQIYAVTEKGNIAFFNQDLNGPVALVMGAEDIGISREVLGLCNKSLKIPIAGEIDSLNVSVAAGIVMFEVVRQRQID